MTTWKGSGASKPVSRVGPPNRLWHAVKHKNFDIFKCEHPPFHGAWHVRTSVGFVAKAAVGPKRTSIISMSNVRGRFRRNSLSLRDGDGVADLTRSR